jgi:hypothetical protein
MMRLGPSSGKTVARMAGHALEAHARKQALLSDGMRAIGRNERRVRRYQ